MAPGRTEGTRAATRPSAGGPPRAGGRERRLFEDVLERLGKSNRERVSARTGSAKKGRTGGCCAGQPGGDAGERPSCDLRAGAGQPVGAAVRSGVRAGWGGQKKEQGQRPCSGESGGMSGCSVLAPTGHCGQTSQTGAEEEHGGGLGDWGARFIRKE